MHHDPLRSAVCKALSRFGHVWALLALWVPLPFGPRGRPKGLAVPLLFQHYVGSRRGNRADAPPPAPGHLPLQPHSDLPRHACGPAESLRYRNPDFDPDLDTARENPQQQALMRSLAGVLGVVHAFGEFRAALVRRGDDAVEVEQAGRAGAPRATVPPSVSAGAYPRDRTACAIHTVKL